MKKEDLQKEAEGFFKQYPKEKKLYATEDGQFFIEGHRNHAYHHAKLSKLAEPFEFVRPEAPATAKPKKPAIKTEEV